MPKKAVKKTVEKPVSKVVEGIDARVLINIYSPDHEPQEFRITIPNIVGATNHHSRTPEQVANAIIHGLRGVYGTKVG